MDILSEEEVSYYKKIAHIPGRKHKKRCARRRTSCCKISTVGRNYPLPFTLLIKVERADVDPRRSASSSSFNALSTSPFATAFFDRGIKITFRVVEHRLAFLHRCRSGCSHSWCRRVTYRNRSWSGRTK